jgi:hypothetical protein
MASRASLRTAPRSLPTCAPNAPVSSSGMDPRPTPASSSLGFPLRSALRLAGAGSRASSARLSQTAPWRSRSWRPRLAVSLHARPSASLTATVALLLNFVTLATPHLGLFALPSRAVEGSAASDDSQSNSSSTTIFRLGTVAVLLATWLATWLATLARTVLALLIFPISMADLCLFTPALGALAEPRAVAVLARFAVRICIGSTRGDTLVPAASSLIATGHGGQDRRENKMASTVAASWWITVATWFAENPFSLLAERRRQRVAAMGAQLDLAGWTRVCVTGTHRDTATTSVRRPEMLRTIERLWVDAGKKK